MPVGIFANTFETVDCIHTMGFDAIILQRSQNRYISTLDESMKYTPKDRALSS